MYKILILTAAILLNALCVGYGWNAFHDPLEFYYFGVRWTARFAAVFFFATYIARPLWQVHHVGLPLIQNRRYLGLATALSLATHTVFIVLLWPTLTQTWPTYLIVLVPWLGGFGLVLCLMMAITSNNRSQKRMGRDWTTLHKTGMHWMWAAFMFDWVAGSLVTLGAPPAGQANPWKLLAVAVFLGGRFLHIKAKRYKRKPV